MGAWHWRLSMTFMVNGKRHTVNWKDLFQPQSAKWALQPLGLIQPIMGLFWTFGVNSAFLGSHYSPPWKPIGHFRVPFSSVSKRVQVRSLSHVNQFCSQVHSDANQTHFHMKGFALGLVLKQRQKATRKWPIYPSLHFSPWNYDCYGHIGPFLPKLFGSKQPQF